MASYKEFIAGGGEKKWQDMWLNTKIDQATDFDARPKKYVLDMFPYPSGAGLHVGHPEGYTATDIYSRYFRLKGFNVLHPMGWDAFGLPAENYAIKTGTQPSITTAENVATFKRQIQALGFSYDWDREVNTTDPKYYKWTQWIFLQLFKKGLAYEATVPINWCPSCKTGLSNEEVKDGKCDRCGTTVERRDMRQWMLKITAYGDRLLEGLEKLDWPESIKTQQRNWIGRSEGAEVDFAVVIPAQAGISSEKHEISDQVRDGIKIRVYTTRPDTLFGATYMVLAPEHELVEQLKDKISNFAEVAEYIARAKNKSDLERTELNKEKTGAELKGIKAINPVNNKEIPIWISDYVLSGYGTGAIMAVPAHDDRDYEFAKKFDIEIITVIEPEFGEKREKEEFKKRIVACVYDPKAKKILTLDWSEKFGGHLLIGGGIEGDESVIEAAQREITEETGYKNLKFIEQSETCHHHYIAHSKGVNRHCDIVGLYFELENDEQVPTSLSEAEQGKFQVKWLDKNQAADLIKDPLHNYLLRKFAFGAAYTDVDRGVMVNSEFLDGLVPEKAIGQMIKRLEKKGVGMKAVNFKLRDWVFSRQRYWGEPIPLVHCDKCGIVPIEEKDLPLTLPAVDKYEPTGTGESPLSLMDDWVNTVCPKCGGAAKRETNTMPQWAGSSWYWLRYIDPNNEAAFADAEKLKYWLPVDLYLGGAEHAVLHLLYARFWNMVLFDIGAVPFEEPFTKLVNQGLILGEDGEKMSKSRGNVVNPDDVINDYGADAFRMYEMFMGPLEDMKPWSTKNIMGVYRYLGKVWELGQAGFVDAENNEVEKMLHKSIKKVGEDIENMSFNTAISQMMMLANQIQEAKGATKETYEKLLIILAPFAPHMCEELWSGLGHEESIFKEAWPEFDPKKVIDAEIELPVQVNGKVRAKLTVPTDISEQEAIKAALADPQVRKYVAGEPKKVIFVKGKLISIVI